jgi:excinuclease ABC subunit C
MDIKKKIKKLPDACGVYFLKDNQGKFLYIGKATSLRKRVSSHFARAYKYSPRQAALIEKTADIDFMQTGSDAEALIYESHFVKLYKPRYNIELKDDKAYPQLKLTLNQPYPRVFITRRRKDDGARYFGPFTSSKLLRQALTVMRKLFPMRTCKTFPKNVCLMYHLGQCLGPCEKKINKKEYDEIVKQLLLFLQGKRDELIKSLTDKMHQAAREKDYEEAARLRDRVKALTQLPVRQRRVRVADSLEELKQALGLSSLPLRIDAFDISNIFGNWAVGSMVEFLDGQPNKKNYRRFKIEGVEGIDDYMMTREVIRRRFTRMIEEKLPLPDLVLIDGGRGHLSTACGELKKLGLEKLPAIAIAKEFEKIYTTSRAKPLQLGPSSSALHLLQRIRDEAHRFAISYHKGLRKKVLTESELDRIPGIGPKRKKDLIKYFGSVENIKKADAEGLLKVSSMNKKTAQAIIRWGQSG